MGKCDGCCGGWRRSQRTRYCHEARVTGESQADIDLHMRLRHRKRGHGKLRFKLEVCRVQAKWVHAPCLSVSIFFAMRLHAFTNWEICSISGLLESGMNLSFWKQCQRNKSVPVLRCLKILIWLRLLCFCQEKSQRRLLGWDRTENT